MKLKLDENIGRRGLELLRAAGHDVMTVRDQNLLGAKDSALFAICARENRALITLDRDFGHRLRFPPETSAGVIILEPGARTTSRALLDRVRNVVTMLQAHSPAGTLWIVEPGRVRIHLRDGHE